MRTRLHRIALNAGIRLEAMFRGYGSIAHIHLSPAGKSFLLLRCLVEVTGILRYWNSDNGVHCQESTQTIHYISRHLMTAQ
jgi:hypothetical protein